MILYISDPHLFDEEIIKIAERPFSCLEEMHEIFRDKWNKKVRDLNTVIIAGDVADCWLNTKPEQMDQFVKYMNSLNGRKHLIIGNHDKKNLGVGKFRRCFTRIEERSEIYDHGQRLFIDHYPCEDWNGMHTGTIHFHGHTHGKSVLADIPGRYDISTDALGFEPNYLEEIISRKK